MKPEVAGPFRSHAWPFNHARNALRRARAHKVRWRSGARFEYGESFSLAKGTDLRAPRFAEFGHHVSIGKNFTCEVDLRVGNYVLISSNVSCIGRDHPFDDPSTTVYQAARVDESLVQIGSDVLIGFGSIIVGSSTIGDGCIVGAGSVVVHDLPEYTVCAGVPAKPIRARFPDGARENPSLRSVRVDDE